MKKLFNNENIVSCMFMIVLFIFRIITYNTMLKDNYILFNSINILGTIVCILIIYVFLNKGSEGVIYSNKRGVNAFMIIMVIYSFTIYLLTYVIKFDMNFTINTALQIFLVVCILIMYPFGIKLSNFNWKISFKEIIIIVLAFLCIKFPMVIFEGKWSLVYYSRFNGNNLGYIYYFFRVFIYPAFNEEVIFRGLLISGLSGYKISFYKINIIQSILFALAHFGVYNGLGLKAIIFMSIQGIMGFILGIIYKRTNSLTPCILFHALLDIG